MNFAPGINLVPAAAADYAVKSNFGKVIAAEESISTKTEVGNGDETEEKNKTENETETEKEVDSLPEDFPMRHVFDKLGFKSVEEVQAKSREDLIALNGIAETTADKALAYGK